MAAYTIRAVALKTGLNPATLRTWERRYAAVSPERQPNGSRAYTESAVRRVHLLKRATDAGHAIRHLAGLSDEMLEKLLDSNPTSQPSLTQDTIAQLLNKIDQLDLQGLERVVATAALSFSPPVLVEQVLGPVMKEVGERWHRGLLSIADEHAVSAAVVSALQAVMRTYPHVNGRPPVIMATLPGERHELGLMMVRYVLASKGVPTHYLGVDLPVGEIARIAKEKGSEVIAISAINGAGMPEYQGAMVELLDSTPSKVRLWVGGARRKEVSAACGSARVECIEDMAGLEQRAWMLGN